MVPPLELVLEVLSLFFLRCRSIYYEKVWKQEENASHYIFVLSNLLPLLATIFMKIDLPSVHLSLLSNLAIIMLFL